MCAGRRSRDGRRRDGRSFAALQGKKEEEKNKKEEERNRTALSALWFFFPPAKVGDVLDLGTMTMRSSPTALREGRWGIACAASAHHVLFMGGKVRQRRGKTRAKQTQTKKFEGWHTKIVRKKRSLNRIVFSFLCRYMAGGHLRLAKCVHHIGH